MLIVNDKRDLEIEEKKILYPTKWRVWIYKSDSQKENKRVSKRYGRNIPQLFYTFRV